MITKEDFAYFHKIKKDAVTSGKALNLVEKGELSEPEEDVPAEIVLEESAVDASEETAEEAVVESDTEIAEAEEAKEVKETEEGRRGVHQTPRGDYQHVPVRDDLHHQP